MKLHDFLNNGKMISENAKPEQSVVDRFAGVAASQRSYYIMKWAEEKGISTDDAMYKAGYVQDGYIGAGAWNWRYVGMDESIQEVAGPDKCWPGHKKVGTQPGTGKNKGKRVNKCKKIEEVSDFKKRELEYELRDEEPKKDTRKYTNEPLNRDRDDHAKKLKKLRSMGYDINMDPHAEPNVKIKKEEAGDEAEGSEKVIPVNKPISLRGDSIWNREGKNPESVNVTEVTVEDEGDNYAHVNVKHDGPWTIYTDTGFEKAISEIVGFEVSFTEQGMQEEGIASLEGNTSDKGQNEDLDTISPLASLEESYDDDDAFFEAYGWIDSESLEEAEYQGRKVKLGKPMQGDVKKFKVYVKNPKGNVVKVNFGHGGSSVKGKAMKIRKSNPKARKSFRARHNCDSPGPRHKARYWSCRKW